MREKQTDVYPLYLSSKQDYKTLDEATKLTVQNLRHIKRAMNRLRDKEGMGGEATSETVEPKFPNQILVTLFRIADFQI